jgi:hypothetical protein
MGGGGSRKSQEVVYTNPGPSAADLAAEEAKQAKLDEEERKRQARRGRASTLLTQEQGGVTNVGQKSLLGG